MSVVVRIGLVSFCPTKANCNADVESVVGAISVPVSVTVCGLLAALVVMTRLPVCTPVAAGVKVSAMVQLACAANVPGLPHAVDGSSANPLPETTSEVMPRTEDWLLNSLTVWIALFSFRATKPKCTTVAEREVCATAKTVENRQKMAVNDGTTTF